MFRWSTSQFRTLCKNNTLSKLAFEVIFSLSFFHVFLSILKYYIYFSTLGCCRLSFHLALAPSLSDDEGKAHIVFRPCPLVLFVYLLMNYADISPWRKLVHATARQIVHLWALPALVCPRGQFSASGEDRNEIKWNHKRKPGGKNRRSRCILCHNISASACVAEPKSWSSKKCFSKTPARDCFLCPMCVFSLVVANRKKRISKTCCLMFHFSWSGHPSWLQCKVKCNILVASWISSLSSVLCNLTEESCAFITISYRPCLRKYGVRSH